MVSSTDIYTLSREPSESRRLDEQHELYVKTLGYLLHPSIAEKLPANPRIADIATGTGVILRDLAAQLPTARFDGFDISPRQFSTSLPENVEMHIADCKQPFPDRFHGQFDVVFVRLLVTAMEPEDWEVVAQNLLALLKPGGALQWVESQFSQILPVLRQTSQATTSGLESLFHACMEAMGTTRVSWDLQGLEGIFKQLGLGNVKQEVYSSDTVPETRALGTKIEIEVCYGALKFLRYLPEDKLEQIRKDCVRDMESGAYPRWNIHCTIGFKEA